MAVCAYPRKRKVWMNQTVSADTPLAYIPHSGILNNTGVVPRGLGADVGRVRRVIALSRGACRGRARRSCIVELGGLWAMGRAEARRRWRNRCRRGRWGSRCRLGIWLEWKFPRKEEGACTCSLEVAAWRLFSSRAFHFSRALSSVGEPS